MNYYYYYYINFSVCNNNVRAVIVKFVRFSITLYLGDLQYLIRYTVSMVLYLTVQDCKLRVINTFPCHSPALLPRK